LCAAPRSREQREAKLADDERLRLTASVAGSG